MSVQRTVRNTSLTPGKTYLIRGKVAFSRITRLTTDAERIAANQHRRFAIDTNYTTITLCDSQVLAANPNAPTNEEIYGKESLYTSTSPNYTGLCFTAISKSQQLPRVFIQSGTNPDGTKRLKEMIPEGELAVGLDVTVQMRVFSSPQNNGVTINMIIINEDTPRYYGGNDAGKKDLEAMGYTLEELPPDQRRRTVEEVPVADMGMTTATPNDIGGMQIDIPEQNAAPAMQQIPQPVANQMADPQAGFAPVNPAPTQGFAPAQGFAPTQGFAPAQGFAPSNQQATPPQQVAPANPAPASPFQFEPASDINGVPAQFGPGNQRMY